MKIKGLQETTLIDYPDKVACTIFTFGCNFHCGFCHNPELIVDDGRPEIKKVEIIKFLEERKKFLDAVCITGGEPTINIDLPDFISDIKSLGYLVKLDTNGSNPEMIEELIDKKLVDYIAMDIKGPIELYDEIAEVKVDKEKIKKSAEIIKRKMKNYEFRITLVPGLFEEEHVDMIGKWLGSVKLFYIQNLGNEKNLDKKFNSVQPFKKEELERFRELFRGYFEKCYIR
jgi:pyruvate formate lyase activating enzyme